MVPVRELIVTADGSHTVSAGGVTYHSMHGAIQESRHVFINEGLMVAMDAFKEAPVLNVIEMGFGTGLNALLTLLEATGRKRAMHYTAIEAFPLNKEEWVELNYGVKLNAGSFFHKLHASGWAEDAAVATGFMLLKRAGDLLTFMPLQQYHVVYFDAFSPGEQPELWTESVFKKLFDAMYSGGILTTYCAKGQVRRNMLAAGFTVERIPGPPGKRQMMRARKP